MDPHLPEPPPQRAHSRKKWLSIWVTLAVVAALSVSLPLKLVPTAAPRPQPTPATIAQATMLPTSTATPQPPAPPVWLSAPGATIAGTVIPVGVAADGAMAAPEGPNNDPVWLQAFWWQYGAVPGQVGNAVIAGHLDRKDGSPAIFWELRKLAVGDSVYVRNQAGVMLHFVVTDVEVFYNPTGGVTDPVMQRIFGSAKTANLNLITCAGDWTGKEYTKELVVFTTLAP